VSAGELGPRVRRHAAEITSTAMQAHRRGYTELEGCVYCGAPRRRPLACHAHSDLLALDAVYALRFPTRPGGAPWVS
jgi:hypothetical protein